MNSFFTDIAKYAFALLAMLIFASAGTVSAQSGVSSLPSPVLINASSKTVGTDIWATETEIRVGQSAPFTGASGEIGKQLRMGADAYFRAVNEQGGVYGRKIRLVAMDDASDPTRALANTQALIETEKVFALLGYFGAAPSAASVPVFTAAKVPFISPVTGAASLRTPFNPYIFNTRANHDDEAHAIVKYLAEAPRNKRIAVFYQDDASGESGLVSVEKALKEFNLALAGKAAFKPGSTDIAVAARILATAAPQTVIMISNYKASAQLVKTMRAMRVPTQFWSFSADGGQLLSAELGTYGSGVGVAQVVPFPGLNYMQLAVEHRAAIGEKDITFHTLEGYLAAKVFVEGLRRAGKSPTRELFVKGLEGAGKLDLGGYAVQFSPTDHGGSNFVDLSMIAKNGKFVR